MSYGSQAKRADSRGTGQLTDVDIYKIGMVGRTERGFQHLLQTEIYSMGDFESKCGLYGDGSDYIAYVAKSFYDELDSGVSVEAKVLGYVASDAAQATYALNDQTGTPVLLWTINAGRRNVADKSAFGNKIALKTLVIYDITMKLTADTAATPTTALLDSVDSLKVGYHVRFADGTNTEIAVITAINTATKQITFAALTNTYTAALTTVSRVDVQIKVAVKSSEGSYDEKEIWEGPMALSSTIGIAGIVNAEADGSEYIIMAHNASNSSPPLTQIPAVLSAWTPLTSGSDGTAPGDSDYKTLLETYFDDSDITFLLSPESTSATHNLNMAAWATDKFKCMYYAQAANKASESTLKNFGALMRQSITAAMLPSDKWIEVTNPINNGKISIPKVGIDAAFWFNVYASFGESKVAAGNKTSMVLSTKGRLVDDNKLVHNDINGVGGRLIRDYSINICRSRRGVGITNNSARTFSTDRGYIFQNQIMQWLLYKKSILAYLDGIEQDKAGINSLGTHYDAVWSYMEGKFTAGHIYQGRKEDGTVTKFGDVCVIVNDFSINTLADIANGIEQIFVEFIAPPPIEEPILSLASAPVTSIRT